MFLRESASNQNWGRWIFRWKIIVGGQINDLWKGKECSFPFLPVTSSSTSCTLEGLFEMTWHHSKAHLWCISCFWNYRDKETPSVVLHPVPWHCREPQLITNLDWFKYTLGFVYPRMGGDFWDLPGAHPYCYVVPIHGRKFGSAGALLFANISTTMVTLLGFLLPY